MNTLIMIVSDGDKYRKKKNDGMENNWRVWGKLDGNYKLTKAQWTPSMIHKSTYTQAYHIQIAEKWTLHREEKWQQPAFQKTKPENKMALLMC